MLSIRLTLSLSLAVLLACALTGGALLAYRTAADALGARAAVTAELIRTQRDDKEADIRARFDKDLLVRARVVAGLVQRQAPSYWNRFRLLPALYPFLGLLTAAGPGSPASAVAGVAPTVVPGPVAHGFYRKLAADVTIADDELPPEPDDQPRFDQVSTDWGGTWRSRSLGEAALPADDGGEARPQPYDWRWRDVNVPPGVPGRMATLWVPMNRSRGRGPPPDRRGDRPGDRRDGGRPPDPGPPPPPPSLVIACAAPLAALDPALAEIDAERDERLRELDENVADTLAGLRWRFVGIGGATFAAALVGALVLIGRGLSPLRRLGEAVGRVTPDNFALPLDTGRLPPELTPIASRLAASLEQLGRAFEREKQAAADISHELRTPLAALLARVDVVLRKPRPAEEYRAALDECREAGRTLTRLVERLLTLTRLDAARGRPSQQLIDAAEVARKCAATVRPLAEARGLALDVDVPAALPVPGDPDRLGDVLTNLLHNAVEYNRPGGRVTLAASAAEGGAVLAVADTGIGMTPEVLARAFERFYRADPARRTEGGHSGLGLAIVKASVDHLGGTIEVSSRPGAGTTFTVRLPRPARVDAPRRAAAQRAGG